MKNKIIISLILAGLLTFNVVNFVEIRHVQSTPPTLGSADSIIPGFSTDSVYIVGKGWATRVAVANPGRTYLEIGNYSGATSTAQAIYCTTSRSVSSATTTSVFSFPAGNATYTGFAIQASSSKVFTRALGVPTTAVYCVNPVASSTVSVVDF